MMAQVAKTAKSQGNGKKKKKGVHNKVAEKKIKARIKSKKKKSKEEEIISRLDRLKNDLDGAQSQFAFKNTNKEEACLDVKIQVKTENRELLADTTTGKKKKKKKKKNIDLKKEEVEKIEVVKKGKKIKKELKQENDKLLGNKKKKMMKKEREKKIKNEGRVKEEGKLSETQENKKTLKGNKKKLKKEKMETKKKNRRKKKKKVIKDDISLENNLLEDTTVKIEPDLDLEYSNDDISKTNTTIDLEDDIKSEPPDSDDADGSGPEGFYNKFDLNLKSNPLNSAPENMYQLEPGEATIKMESDVILCEEIKKESLDNNESEKKEFLVCFRNLIRGSEEEKIKELSYRVLDSTEIVDLFLVKDRKKRFGFLKVTSREALEKVLKLDGWAVDGRIIRVAQSNLINVKKEPPITTNLNLTPPPESKSKKRKFDDFDTDVIEEEVLEKRVDNILSDVKKKIKLNDDDEKLCKRYSVFLGNLNYEANDDKIKTFLETIVAPEKIKRVHLPKTKSYAFVDLKDEESLQRVLKLTGSKFMGRTVRIEVSEEGNKKRNESAEKGGEYSTFRKTRNFLAKPKHMRF